MNTDTEQLEQARRDRDIAEAKCRWIEGVKPCATAVELSTKLPPDILMAPMPFPHRMDYAAKMIQTAFEQWLTGDMLEILRERNDLAAKLAAALAEAALREERIATLEFDLVVESHKADRLERENAGLAALVKEANEYLAKRNLGEPARVLELKLRQAIGEEGR